MSFESKQESIFDFELKHEDVLEVPEDYNQIRLADLEDKETFTGKPQVSGLMTSEFEDGFEDDGKPKMRTVHKIRMIITNDDNEEYLDININLKQASLKVPAIRKGSVLFDFVQSILELENKGITQGKNLIENINLQQFIDFLNKNCDKITVKNIERHGKFNFNSFYITSIDNSGL
ncbi:hypothetical protein [Methanobrevibacter sp.]